MYAAPSSEGAALISPAIFGAIWVETGNAAHCGLLLFFMSDELSPEVFDAVCRQADQAARAQERLAQANTEAKNELLLAIADALDEHAADIEAANALDMLESKENGMDAGKLDRLLFDVPRVAAAAQGVRHVATLPDPVGEIVRGYNLPNGLRLTQTRVPMGVIGMIYEARPNVTVDVASLCLKSGNAGAIRRPVRARRRHRHDGGARPYRRARAARRSGSDPSRRAQLQSAGHRNRCRQRAYLYRQVR